MAFQMDFFHWNMHGKKSYIYTIQHAILSICLFKIASPIEDALGITFVGKKRYFSILFGFFLEMCKTSKEKLKYKFFIFGYPFSFSLEML